MSAVVLLKRKKFPSSILSLSSNHSPVAVELQLIPLGFAASARAVQSGAPVGNEGMQNRRGFGRWFPPAVRYIQECAAIGTVLS